MNSFTALATETGELISLRDDQGGLISFDDWSLRCGGSARFAAETLLDLWANNEVGEDGRALVSVDEATGVLLHPQLVARLGEEQARAIGLPPATALQLELEACGAVGRKDFAVNVRWVRPGGLSARTREENGRLNFEGSEWRIAEPLFTALKSANFINATEDPAAKNEALAMLRHALGDWGDSRIKTGEFLKRLRISYAAGFSLDLNTDHGQFDFQPRLFSRAVRGEAEEGQSPDAGDDSLLPQELHETFLGRFAASRDVRSSYLLGDGSIVFLDPDLKKALGIVRRAQGFAKDLRKEFALNPRRYLAEAWSGGDADPDAISRLFVETQQYSERVNGIDIWRRPVLPWIKPKPESWLPEGFYLRIGEHPDEFDLEVDPQDLDQALAAVELAIAEEKPTFEIGGNELPATSQARDALLALKQRASLPTEAEHEAGKADEPPQTPEPLFLTVGENFDQVNFSATPRRAALDLSTSPRLPASVTTEPKPHQTNGFEWLCKSWSHGLPGVLLADDMGLGKTFQLLSFLVWLRSEAREREPFLVVAPTGLLENWREEIQKHLVTDALGPILLAYGRGLSALRTGRGRDTGTGSAQLPTSAFDGYGLVLTTYETLRDYHMSFARQRFSVAVCDEVQKIKNPASQLRRAATTINARFRVAMTGTPVENRLQDLWTVMDWVWPNLLGSSREFEHQFREDNQDSLGKLRSRLAEGQDGAPPIMLRRMKSEVLEGLPTKSVVQRIVEMPDAQAERYAAVLEEAMLLRGSGKRGLMLEVLHKLRGTSLYPDDPNSDTFSPEHSARLKALFDILSEIQEKGEKVLVFCEDLAMQARLAAEIRQRFSLVNPVPRIHGGVGPQHRQELVNTFQSRPAGFDVMILSPRAGGVGLTLTAANHVVHVSRWWNPAVEDQATDRVHRIGQELDVTVHLPLAVHPNPQIRETSFDIKLDALMARKRELSARLLMPGELDSDVDNLFESLFENPGHSQLSESRVAASIQSPPPKPTTPTTFGNAFKEFNAGDRRDWDIFGEVLSGERVVHLEIRDPYAMAGRHKRNLTTNFAVQLARLAVSIDRVLVIVYDAESVNRDNPEPFDWPRRDMQDIWEGKFYNRVPLDILEKSRREDRSFHDRKIEVRLRDGKVYQWTLTNGIDGFMSPDRECSVMRVCRKTGYVVES